MGALVRTPGSLSELRTDAPQYAPVKLDQNLISRVFRTRLTPTLASPGTLILEGDLAVERELRSPYAKWVNHSSLDYGRPGETLGKLTGISARSYNVEQFELLLNVINSSGPSGNFISVLTLGKGHPGDSRLPSGFSFNHAYAVLGSDGSAVHVIDPRNSSNVVRVEVSTLRQLPIYLDFIEVTSLK